MNAATKDAVQLLCQGSRAMARMEAAGIRVDTDYLERAIKEVTKKVRELEANIKGDPIYARWRRRFGSDANLDSGPQLAKVLYTDMGLPVVEKTEKGAPAVNEKALLRVNLPFVKDFLRRRKMLKLRDTYLKGFAEETV